jgi:hypothetical protein
MLATELICGQRKDSPHKAIPITIAMAPTLRRDIDPSLIEEQILREPLFPGNEVRAGSGFLP